MHVGLWKTEYKITTFLRLADADNSVYVLCTVCCKAFILYDVSMAHIKWLKTQLPTRPETKQKTTFKYFLVVLSNS